jgi:hypothetical protein
MDAPETGPEKAHTMDKVSAKDTTLRILGLVKRWASRHTGEIVWAFVFAVLAGYVIALYSEDPKPYKIYIVADRDTDSDTMKVFQAEDQQAEFARIGRVKVQVQLEMLDNTDQTSGNAAQQMAQSLVDASDTLLVIEHARSQNIENSLQTYFHARPQVPLITTVATDDDLLAPCLASQASVAKEDNQDSLCFDGYWVDAVTKSRQPFAPLLQLSPTNHVQAASAVQFAVQNGKHSFLIVLGNDPKDQSYTVNMDNAYSDAIHAANAHVVGIFHMDNLPKSADFERLKPDCVLYAGGFGEAQTLFNGLSTMRSGGPEFTLMLSDSVIQSRGTDDLAEFTPEHAVLPVSPSAEQNGPVVQAGMRERIPAQHSEKSPQGKQHSLQVNFTYQTDAGDYDSHSNPYVKDAFSVALQLINDLNDRGSDLGLRVKSLFHVQSAKDVRRNLLRIMRQNSSARTWYKSASGIPYVFDGPKQYRGIFHVWQLRPQPSLVAGEMDDVDHWHIPRPVADGQGGTAVAIPK